MLNSRFPDLAALQLLLVVARTGSLNAAATEIGITQQAASARITSTEAQTGVVLMSRTARGSTLTAAGTVVAEWAARLLDVAAEVDAGLASLRSDRASTLRVSASLTIAEQLLPGWLVTLNADQVRRALAPVHIVLRATNSDTVAVEVRDGAADVGFVEGPVAPRGLRSRQVGHDRLVVVVRPDHPWARRRTPVTSSEIAATALVTREEGSGTRSAFETALHAVLSVDQAMTAPALALSTSAAVRAAVIAGAGPAVLSELAVADDLSSGRLREIRVSNLDLRRTLRAVWVGSKTPPAGAARDLIALAATRTRASTTAKPQGGPRHRPRTRPAQHHLTGLQPRPCQAQR